WLLNWTYSSNTLSGIYSSRLAMTDNSGVSATLSLSYTIFATWFLKLQAESLDPVPVPVARASVTLFVGAVAVYNGASDSLGFVSPQNIILRDNATYNIKAYWQGSPVNLKIYDLTVVVVDPSGQAVSGATVALTLSGQTISQNTTGNTGVLLFHALPKGQYVVQVTSQSQTIRNTLDLSQSSTSKIQFSATPATTSWVTQSLNWILLGAAVGGILGYGQFYRMKHPFREEPFEYLDNLTAGGFRDGDTVLIEGDTSSGKTTLCEELAYKSLQSAHPVVFLTYDNPDTVKKTMKTMHWDTSKDEA